MKDAKLMRKNANWCTIPSPLERLGLGAWTLEGTLSLSLPLSVRVAAAPGLATAVSGVIGHHDSSCKRAVTRPSSKVELH